MFDNVRLCTFNLSKKEDVLDAFFYPQSVIDVCDLIEEYAGSNLVLFDVAHTVQDCMHQVLSLQGLVSYEKFPYSVIDSDTIVIAKESLKPLLTDLFHYDLTTIDIGNEWNEYEVIGEVITCKEHDWRKEKFLLPSLPSSQNYIHSHDDCFLNIQTYDPSFVMQIFTRTLQIYVGIVLAEISDKHIVVSEIPEELLKSFWVDNFGLTILRKATQVEKNGLMMGVAKIPYSFRTSLGPPVYQIDFWIRYDALSQYWYIES